jgi:hypothetical protein
MVNPKTNQRAFTVLRVGQQHGKQCRNFTLSLDNHLHAAQSMDIKRKTDGTKALMIIVLYGTWGSGKSLEETWKLTMNEKHEK